MFHNWTVRLILALFMISWSATGAASTLSVFVSVLPQRFILERLGGEHIRVLVLVKPGHSPTTYAPTPRQMAALENADLYVRIGVPFENAWMEKIQSSNPGMKVFDARNGIQLREIEGGDGLERQNEFGHFHEKDPHIWLSPTLVMQMADHIRALLTELDPENGRAYDKNFHLLIADLVRLDRDIKRILATVRNRSFLVFHPAWGYFADAYDLRQIAIERGGKEPGPRSLAELIERAKRLGIKKIFVDPLVSRKQVNAIAAAIDGRVVEVDPLSENYSSNLLQFARQLAQSNR